MGESARFRWWARAFGLGSLVHLTLPDFEQAGWGLPGVIEAVGAVWLLWRPAAPAFALCLVGTLWPLLFLRDVLTQSALLSLWAALGLVGALRPTLRTPALAAVGRVTAGTYLLAALHKLNTAFFTPELGCAEHAWRQVAERYGLPDGLPAAPYLAVGIEVALGILLWRRSGFAWPLGIAFHLPLTVTLAPAFGAVMLAGYVATLDARALVKWRRMWWRRWPWILGLGGAATVVEWTWAARGEVGPALKTGAAMAVFLLGISTLRHRAAACSHPLPRLALGLWLANGLTPYLGLQYQHTAAMLSGLRIDAGCHNSLVVPEALVIEDPYLRIDAARIGPGKPYRERILLESLWNLPALHTMHRNWCIPEHRPITLGGTWRGEAFHIPDLCAADWQDALPDRAWLPGFQRFQKNLGRACLQACIH